MVGEPPEPQRRPFVFVIMPFDEAWTDHYELGIKPACDAAGADCARVDEQIFVETILERIYAQIEAADVVVAEMTDRNANVFYEAGYAHGLRKPVIFLTRTADDIPFDLRHHPHIVHGDRIATFKPRLEEHVRYCLEHPDEVNTGMDRRGAAEQAEHERMAQHIENYARAGGFSMVSFARIRESINPAYSDERLLRLIDQAPGRFRRVRMKGKPGIGLVSGN